MIRVRRHLRIIICVAVIVMLAQAAMAGVFWGSAKSNKYHYPDCRWAQKIHAENLIVFESVEEAVRRSYVPCKVCRPPG